MKIRRIVLSFLLVAVVASTLSGFTFASENSEPAASTQSASAEETKWYYDHDANGVPIRRLWSITRGIWLTDWVYYV